MGKGNIHLEKGGKKDVLRQIDKTPAPKAEDFVFAVPAVPLDPKILAKPMIERAEKIIKSKNPTLTKDKGTMLFNDDLENLVIPPHLVDAQGKIRIPRAVLVNYKRGAFALFKADDMQQFYDKQMKNALLLSTEGSILGVEAQKVVDFSKQMEMFNKAGAKKMEAAEVLHRCMEANSYIKNFRDVAREAFRAASIAANCPNDEIDTILKLQYLMTKWLEQN